MSAIPRVLTLLWSEKLSTRMFVDFYRKIYLGGATPMIRQPSMYNSLELVEAQYTNASAVGKPCLFSFLEVPKLFEGGKLPQSLLDASDMVLHFKQEGTGRGVLTLPVKVSSEQQYILDRWSANLLRMQQIV